MEKEQIISRAKDLFMRYGIRSVTMDDVSRELGISKKTLYGHVENKRDLIRQALNIHYSNECEVLTSIHNSSKDALQEMILMSRYLIELFRKMKPSLIYELNKYHKRIWIHWDKRNRNYIYKVIKENIIRGQKENVYRANLNPDIIAKIYVSKTYAVLDEQLFPKEEYKMEELYRENITYHLHGIVSELGLQQLKDTELITMNLQS